MLVYHSAQKKKQPQKTRCLLTNWKSSLPSNRGRCQNIYTLTCKSDKSRFTKIVISSWGCNSQISPDSHVWRGRDLQSQLRFIWKKPVSRSKWPTSQSLIMDSLCPVTLSKQQSDRKPVSVPVFENPTKGQLEKGRITFSLKPAIPHH